MNNDLMKSAGFSTFVDMVDAGVCPFCKKMVDTLSFKDALSLKEYAISGLCQTCQDEVFEALEELEDEDESCRF